MPRYPVPEDEPAHKVISAVEADSYEEARGLMAYVSVSRFDPKEVQGEEVRMDYHRRKNWAYWKAKLRKVLNS